MKLVTRLHCYMIEQTFTLADGNEELIRETLEQIGIDVFESDYVEVAANDIYALAKALSADQTVRCEIVQMYGDDCTDEDLIQHIADRILDECCTTYLEF